MAQSFDHLVCQPLPLLTTGILSQVRGHVADIFGLQTHRHPELNPEFVRLGCDVLHEWTTNQYISEYHMYYGNDNLSRLCGSSMCSESGMMC